MPIFSFLRAKEYFAEKRDGWSKEYKTWKASFESWAASNPALKAEWDSLFSLPDIRAAELPAYKAGEKVATRSAGCDAQNALGKVVPHLVGGSADLAGSNKTSMPEYGEFSKTDKKGRTINYGVRGTRDGRNYERNRYPWRVQAVLRHFFGFCRLHAPGNPARRTDEAAGNLYSYP